MEKVKDTIYRQDAIDVLDKHLRTTDVPVSYPGIISALTEWLNELPTAQPELLEIIRCKECKHYKAYDYTGYLACHLVVGGTVRRDLDDFCSKAERREE